MKRGDIILEFGGKKIGNPEELQSVVGKTAPGKKVDVIVMRAGEKKTLEVVLGEWPEEVAASAEKPYPEREGKVAVWKGLKVKEITKDLIDEFSLNPGEEGVAVVEIDSGSKADEMGLSAGDVIRSINRQKTGTLAEFEAAVKKVNLAEGVLFDISRGGTLIYQTYIEK